MEKREADFNLPPGMVYKWKQGFLQNAHHAISTNSEQKAGEGKADRFKRKNEQMLIHRAFTLARDFPQVVFAKLEKQSQAC